MSLQQMESDVQQARQQYRGAIEENGRLEGRIQALAINAQSEQDTLSTEVGGREGARGRGRGGYRR